MVNYFIYAKDFSGSTNRQHFYHENALKTVYQFKMDVKTSALEDDKIVYLHWGDRCEEVSEIKTVDDYKHRIGNGSNTLPETIIQWIQRNVKLGDKIKLLYIITDGMISRSSLHKCLRLNQYVDYEKVYFHAINSCVDRIDLSVASSFLKSHCIVYRNNEKFDETDISQEFDYNTITIDNFGKQKDLLKSYIKLKFLNSSKRDITALNEIEKLTKLRKRLFHSLLAVSEPVNLETRDKNTFIQKFKETAWYKNLINESFDLKTDIHNSISTLINYIVCKKRSYAFDALKFETKFSDEVPEEELVDVHFENDQEIEFPDIILDDEKGIPVILFTELNLLKKIIFKTSESDTPSPASFSKFTSAMECPLFLMYDDDLNDSIGYFYTLDVYKHLLEKTTKTEPRTRRPYQGGLVLVDTDDFDAYNDYIISATYFNSKKVNYNIGLFYFVLWKICEKKEWMDRNVVEQFKKYMLRRVKTTVCMIGLSSLPLDPRARTSLPTALWYCVELSSDIFKSDPVHFAHERLRKYYGVAPHMIEILKCLHYDLDLKNIRKRRDLLKHVMALKKLPTRRDKVFYLMDKILKNVNDFLVSEIENQCNVKKLDYLKLHHKEMLTDEVVSEDININDYVYFLHQVDDSGVQICETTLRPYFMIDENKSFYSELYETGKQVVVDKVDGKVVLRHEAMDSFEFSKILSYHNLFVQCVKGLKKFPTLEEYSNYILKKRKFKEDLVTVFPVGVNESIERAFLAYQNVIKDKSVSEFVSQCNKYASRSERIKTENIKKFEDDKEILQFIATEETKVNFKKLIPTNSNEKVRKVLKPATSMLSKRVRPKILPSRGGRGRGSFQNSQPSSRPPPPPTLYDYIVPLLRKPITKTKTRP